MESTRHSSWYMQSIKKTCWFFHHSRSQMLNSSAKEKVGQGQQKSNSNEHFKYTEFEFAVVFLNFYLNFYVLQVCNPLNNHIRKM